jgi:hypothetical protein
MAIRRRAGLQQAWCDNRGPKCLVAAQFYPPRMSPHGSLGKRQTKKKAQENAIEHFRSIAFFCASWVF